MIPQPSSHAHAQKVPIRSPSPFARHAPLLISLPQGLGVSGVAVWAVRLANSLVASGRLVSLILHDEPAHQPFLALPLDPRVGCLRLAGLPPLADAVGDLTPFIAPYRDAIHRLSHAAGMPVVMSPNLLGDCYGIAAAISLVAPERLRVVGWQHSTASYDNAVLRRYDSILSAIVCLSRPATAALAAELPHRARDIACIPHGVEVPGGPLEMRAPLGLGTQHPPTAQRPLRLIYTGRIESATKRVGALLLLSRELDRRNIPHSLTLIGDGPAARDIHRRVGPRPDSGTTEFPNVRLLPPVQPHRLAPHLDHADAFILASRNEGLSLSRIEAMARGCVPVVTHLGSGAAEGLVDGVNAILADAPSEADDTAAAASLAEAVQRLLSADVAALSHAAWRTAGERFNLARSAAAVSDLLDSVALLPPRPWPADRACAYTGGAIGVEGRGGTGAVPPDGPARFAAVLKSLAGRAIIVHGAGRHTIELAAVLAQSPASIVGITDDDPSKWRTRLLGWTIMPPTEAASLGATDVVISSSIHSNDIWGRRAAYEQQGLRVHRVYGDC